jgi:ankyrin repeat protein
MKKAFGVAALLLSTFPAAGWAGPADDRLVEAVRANDNVAVKSLLASGANANTQLADKSTILGWAIDRQNDETVKLLLAAGANANTADPTGIAPLALACEFGNPAIVTSLLVAGADVKVARPEGVTVLALCAGSSTPDVLEALIAKGADANQTDPQGQTPLMWAAMYGKPDNIALLVKKGADVNAVEKSGFTPLFFALRSKNAQAPMRLLEAGANVKAVIPGGASVLEAAVTVGNVPFAMQAVRSGVDVKHRDNQGRTAIHIAAATGNADFVKLVLSKGGDANALTVVATPAPVVVASAASTAAKPVLGAQPVAEEPRRPKPYPVPATPLQFAARAGSVDAMKALVAAGAKPGIKGPDGMTVALAAASGGHLEAMKYAYELDPHLDAIARGGRGPLHLIVANKQAAEPEAVILFLADKGAKLDLKDERDSTAGDDVNRFGAENVRVFFIQLLRDRGIISVAH